MKQKAAFLAILVFIACLAIGFWIAQHKYVWNDECYSAVSSVDGTSYTHQILGKIPEGNNTPLFYILQKSFCQLTGYQIPSTWKEGHWNVNKNAQIILRIVPVTCMSLSIALIFFYFANSYSLLLAIFSFVVYLSSYMLWIYWAEARPYPAIVLVTTIQSVLLLRLLNKTASDGKVWKSLAVVHVLMALTFIFSLGQIAAASLVVWLNKERDWKKYLFLTILPIGIALFYYSQAPKYPFYMEFSPEQLIRDNMSRERFYIFFIFSFLLLAYWIVSQLSWKRFSIGREIITPFSYFLFTALALAATLAVIFLFTRNQCLPGQGFPVTSRYFIYLMPIGVIAATMMTDAIIRSLSMYRWLQWAILVLIVSWVIQRFLKVVPSAIHSILGS